MVAGFLPVAAVEIDSVAADSYELNVGLRPTVRDIRRVPGRQLLDSAGLERGQCTVLFGCPPCQSFTILRQGAKVSSRDRRRNALPREYLRFVSEVLPRYVAFENVPGMVERRGRYRFDELVEGLKNLGYQVVWDLIDAADFGIPQYRRRLLVIASRVTTPRLPAQTHSPGTVPGLPRHVTVRATIGHLRQLEAGQADPGDPYHQARHHNRLVLQRLRLIPEGGGRKDLPPRLQLDCHKGHGGHYDVYGRMWWDRPAPTLTSGCTNVTRGRFAHPTQHRAITVREAMILQGFPSHARLCGGMEEMALQVGNAVPPPLAECIARCVLAMEHTVRSDPSVAA
jgi:DNA (cytosine-5)-methyltransferase 1